MSELSISKTSIPEQTLSEEAIINKIKQREFFTATIDGGGFTLKIDKYEPALCAAIHNGGNLRSELADNCLLTQTERYYEEDPYTASFVAQQAITLTGNDSRYEYDLNRNTDECVYETAWGKEVWKTPLSATAIATSKAKHAQFYRIVSAVVEALAEDFGECLVYDNHSYNYRRHERTDLPVFNLGTSSVKSDRWRPVIDAWLAALKNIKVDGADITAAENDIFFGKGYLAAHCHGLYDNVLVLATEVKKVFMNELTGEADPIVLPSMQTEYNAAVRENISAYIKSKANPLNPPSKEGRS
ncbi:N-formylglutamate amidohydrolase [sulfur-oxidizing endosymbiont of Gigantopelta aegis]|uniref:N-formylglutamate amidohydrolase n=1 Tax=sulfur-oxidizing endosymbiont of Gigantopelta aegis TaxID=2794934 RepID=UPI0018DE350D|nr:N-formylglutamate amidohydrolase [sulfur-oxidizing endosymbiont of Gigantopelta aegis]